jgi:hypothetical protein
VASDPLPAPADVVATPRASGVDLKWKSVPSASFYKVELSPEPQAGTRAVVGSSATSLRIDRGLEDKTTYSVTVAAFDDDNAAGTPSSPVSFTTLAHPAPAANPVFEPDGENAYLVTWDPSPDDGGSSITSYRAACTAGGTFSTVTTSSAATSALIRGVPVTSEATCTVTVFTGAGGMTQVDAVRGSAVRPPSAVVEPRAGGLAMGVKVTWEPPLSVHSSSDGFSYNVRFEGCGERVEVDVTSRSVALPVKRARCSGTVTIIPANKAGEGPATSIPATTGDRLLTSPFDLRAVPMARGARLLWRAPVDEGDGRSPPEAYELRIIREPGARQRVEEIETRGRNYLHRGRRPFVAMVAAENGAGRSVFSSALYGLGGVDLITQPLKGGLIVRAVDRAYGREPAKGLRVRVRRSAGGLSRVVRLSSRGRKRLTGLARGRYVVRVIDERGSAKGLPERTVLVP